MTSSAPTQGVISEAWELYRTHARHLLLIAFIVYAGVGVVSFLLATTGGVGVFLGLLIGVIAGFWVQGALVAAVQDIRDGRADLTIGETFRSVSGVLATIVGASIIMGIGIGLGLLLLIIPGLILLTLWAVAIPAVVLERRGVFDSLGRSFQLVRPWAFAVFGIIVIVFLIQVGVQFVVGALLAPLDEGLASFLGSIVYGTLISPFAALVGVGLYYRLTGAGVAPESLPSDG